MAEQEKSIAWVVGMLMVVVALFGWAFMAAAYAHETQGWRRGGVTEGPPLTGRRTAVSRAAGRAFADFVSNAVVQIPSCFSVLTFNLQHRIWLPVAILAVEGGALFGGYKLKALEQELSTPHRRRR